LLDISVKFHDDSFIGCQDICENALNWLMLEVLPQKRILGYKWGRLILATKWYLINIFITKTRFVVHWASSHVLWTSQRTKKSRRCGNFTPTPTLYPLSGVSQFRYLPLTGDIALTAVYALTCYTLW